MGTSCCNGRRQAQASSQLPVSKTPAKTRRRSRLSTRVSDKSAFSSFLTPSSPLQHDSVRLKSVSLHFQDSLQKDDFVYHLSPLGPLDITKKVHIHKALKGTGEAEVCLGFAEVLIGPEKDRQVAIVGSQSLICVDYENYGRVHRRVKIREIKLISVNFDRSAAILHIREEQKDNFDDLMLSSGKLEDILKAVELAIYDLEGFCIGAQICPTNSAFLALYNRLPDALLEQFQVNLVQRLTEVTCKYGLIGESKLYFKQTTLNLKNSQEKRTCLLTTHAVYCLNEAYNCFSRLALEEVRAVIAVTGKEFLILATDREEQVWTLPAVVGECVINAAQKLGNERLKLQWKSAKSFTEEHTVA